VQHKTEVDKMSIINALPLETPRTVTYFQFRINLLLSLSFVVIFLILKSSVTEEDHIWKDME